MKCLNGEVTTMNTTKNTIQDKPLFVQNAGLFIFAAALPFSVSLIQGGVLLFIVSGLWRRYNSPALPALAGELKATPLFVHWGVYLAAGILAAAFGVNPARSFAALNSDLLTAAAFLGLCLFLGAGPKETALKIYVAAVTVVALWGVTQALVGLAQGVDVRAHANSHPVRFGEIMVIGLAQVLSLLSYPETISARLKKFLFAAALLIFSAVILSQTRGAYLGMSLVFIALLAARRPSMRGAFPLIAAAAALGLTLAILSPTVRYKLGSISKGANSAMNAGEKTEDGPINTRLDLWKTGFKMIKDRPLLGAGPANVKTLFPSYHPDPYPEGKIWGSLHNLYIHQTAERGFVGLAALLALFGGMLVISLRNFRASQSPSTLCALAIMPAWFLMNVTEITFQHVHTSYAVLLVLAASVTAVKK